MNPNLKFVLGSVLSLPLLPLMYYQGIRIRSSVPRLPEARGTTGIVRKNDRQLFRLLAVGESTVAGIGVKTHEEGFTGTLAKCIAERLDTDVHWEVFAKSGFTAKKVREELVPLITRGDIDLVVIGLGGNDAFKLNSPDRWKRDVKNLIGAVRQKLGPVPLAFTNMPPIKDFPAFTGLIKLTIGNLGELLGQALEHLVSEYENVHFYSRKITLEDWIARLGMNAEPGDFFSDGVHPSKLTYQVWAKDFCDFLFEAGVILPKENTVCRLR